MIFTNGESNLFESPCTLSRSCVVIEAEVIVFVSKSGELNKWWRHPLAIINTVGNVARCRTKEREDIHTPAKSGQQ